MGYGEKLLYALLAVSLLGLTGSLIYHAIVSDYILFLPASITAWLGYALLTWIKEGKDDY